jgi:3-oxoacyl-[acyl-carrier-protein] synthase-3
MATLETPQGAKHAAILGVGAYRPSRVIPNADIVEAIDSSDEWIQQRSGIKQRLWATAEETVQLMGVESSKRALEAAGIDARQIDCVVVATVSHLLQTPAVATAIAHELGTDQAAAFDISAACAGFCHGVAMAADFVRAGSASHVLVIGVERLSDLTDVGDRGTAFIFADGAGAAVIGPSDTPGIGPVVWGSDGEQFDLIRQREDWRDVIASHDPVMPHLVMQGNPVFRWASFAMAKVGQQALDRAGITADELDVFVPHQANMRIIDAMARSMKLPERVKIARDIA